MTEAEKNMKKYVNAVERRLNLPRDVKLRVMSDFSSSINARREAGMTDAEIYAELGTPQKAAVDLNEQMKEFAYRKSLWRYVFAAMAIYGAIKLLGSVWANLLYWFIRGGTSFTSTEAASIGIIGGADGPTAVFLTTSTSDRYIIYCLLLLVGVWGFLKLRKCIKK